MIKVSKTEFLEMFDFNILNGSNKQNKEWTVTGRGKPARRKKRHVHEADYTRYLMMKNKDNKT